MLAAEKCDDYGRDPHDERPDTILPLSDLLASSIICMFTGLDPPDTEIQELDGHKLVTTTVFWLRVFASFIQYFDYFVACEQKLLLE